MKISQVIKELQEILEKEGDLPCLIEVMDTDCVYDISVDECAVEIRGEYGLSVKFLQ